MSRKICAFLLVVLMACSCFTVSSAAVLDLSSIRENSELFSIDVDTESDVAFIESQMSAQLRSFVHKYESSYRYSNTLFDILVVDYLKTDAYPIMRLWIIYCADDAYLNINSVSFIVDGKKYTFSGIADADWYEHDDNGYVEKVLLKFGMENLSFLAALERVFSDVKDGSGAFQAAQNASCRMILHGREDIEVELGAGFFTDYLIMHMGFTSIDGLSYLNKVISSTMKETDVP